MANVTALRVGAVVGVDHVFASVLVVEAMIEGGTDGTCDLGPV
jgi:hypothetical protein